MASLLKVLHLVGIYMGQGKEKKYKYYVSIGNCIILLLLYYSKRAVEEVQSLGKVCVLDIDIQGVKQIKRTPHLDPLYVFVKPPSIVELERRLKARNTETEESLERRLSVAKAEMEYGMFQTCD